jgi:hypothetical protein
MACDQKKSKKTSSIVIMLYKPKDIPAPAFGMLTMVAGRSKLVRRSKFNPGVKLISGGASALSTRPLKVPD